MILKIEHNDNKNNCKYNNLKMELWNEYIYNNELIEVSTASDTIYLRKITFKYPLYIKIGDLKAIPMYSFSFPLEKDPKNKYILLGLDYLSNIKLTIQPYIDINSNFIDDEILLTLEDI